LHRRNVHGRKAAAGFEQESGNKIELDIAESEMGRYLPGVVLAVFGILVYIIGCALFVAHRRQRARGMQEGSQGAPGRSLFVYAIVMMTLGIAALGGGLVALETAQYHALGQ
jgi:hypothetical protein